MPGRGTPKRLSTTQILAILYRQEGCPICTNYPSPHPEGLCYWCNREFLNNTNTIQKIQHPHDDPWNNDILFPLTKL